MSVFFTSDSHFGHRNILDLGRGRPFATIQEHDEALIENWNRVVTASDTVWHLGDFSLSVAVMEAVIPRLHGHRILVAGNHDGCWTGHPDAKRARKAERAVQRYLAAGWDEVHSCGTARTTIASKPVMLAHLPAAGDHAEHDRYRSARPNPRGLPLVCGHVHHLWRSHGRQVNVGVDHWDYTPVHEDQVGEVIASWRG